MSPDHRSKLLAWAHERGLEERQAVEVFERMRAALHRDVDAILDAMTISMLRRLSERGKVPSPAPHS